jgi:hypothetical protein
MNLSDARQPRFISLPPGQAPAVRRVFLLSLIGNLVVLAAVVVIGLGFGGVVTLSGDPRGLPLLIAGLTAGGTLTGSLPLVLSTRSLLAAERINMARVTPKARTARSLFWIALASTVVIAVIAGVLVAVGDLMGAGSAGLGLLLLASVSVSLHSTSLRLGRLAQLG